MNLRSEFIEKGLVVVAPGSRFGARLVLVLAIYLAGLNCVRAADLSVASFFESLGIHDADDESYVSRLYNIPSEYDPVEVLTSFVRETLEDRDVMLQDQDFAWMVVGDAFHWIGHLYQDRKESKEQIKQSFSWAVVAYRNSRYIFSPFLANLDGRAHAMSHLLSLKRIKIWPGPTVLRGPPMISEIDYRKRIAPKIRASLQAIDSNSCFRAFQGVSIP